MKLIQKLRDATKDQHARLDQIPEMKRVTSEKVKAEDYKNYLLAFKSIYKTIESKIYNNSSKYIDGILLNQRLAHINNDLNHFDNEKVSFDTRKKLDLEDKEYLGALYVMEGSRLGGNLIGKHLMSHLNFEKSYLEFLMTRPSVKWPQIIALLNEQSEEDHVAIIKGAQKVFQYFYDQLSEFYNSIE